MRCTINANATYNFLHKSPLPAIVLLTGEEVLLNMESLNLLRRRAAKDGFNEKRRIDIITERSNSCYAQWKELLDEFDNPSLFSPKILLELHSPQKSLDTNSSKILSSIIEKPNADTRLILFLPNLEKYQTSSWYKNATNSGDFLEIKSTSPVDKDFETQVQQRIAKAGLKLSQDAYQKFLDYHDGNLLAAQQSINRLAQYPDHQQLLDNTQIEERLDDLARYSVNDFTNALLHCDWLSCYRSAQKIELTDKNLIELLNWHIRVNISVIIQLLSRPKAEQKDIFAQAIPPIYPRRQQIFQAVLSRWNITTAISTLQLAGKIDRINRGAEAGNTWQTLRQYFLLRAAKNKNH